MPDLVTNKIVNVWHPCGCFYFIISSWFTFQKEGCLRYKLFKVEQMFLLHVARCMYNHTHPCLFESHTHTLSVSVSLFHLSFLLQSVETDTTVPQEQQYDAFGLWRVVERTGQNVLKKETKVGKWPRCWIEFTQTRRVCIICTYANMYSCLCRVFCALLHRI